MSAYKGSEDKKWGWITLGIVVTFFIIAVSAFLGKDEGGISGWQALGQQSAGFWVLASLLSLGAGVIVHFATKAIKKGSDSRITIPAFIVIGVFLSIAFGRACTDKANDGVTSPKGRPEK